jgi:hypothetical protein
VAQYLRGCERSGSPGLGAWLASERLRGKAISFCAAARGFAERAAAEPGETLPPWRAGARELMRDAQSGRSGRWVAAADMRPGLRPAPGSVVVYWRVRPDAWQGHVETLIEATEAGYRSVGANERGGRWYIDAAPVSWRHERLLGFVVPWEPSSIAESPPPPDLKAEPELGIDDEAIFARQITTLDHDSMQREHDRLLGA